MKNFIIAALIFSVLLTGCIQQPAGSTASATSLTPAPGTPLGEAPPEMIVNSGESTGPEPIARVGEIKEFDVTAKRFDFSPNLITVNLGDTVKLNITSIDVAHGFSLPDFGINETISPGQTVIVEFVADKAGTFSYSCSVYCGLGHSGMGGTLIVE